MNARAYVLVSLQPERGKVGHKYCSLVKGTKTPAIEALCSGATTMRCYSSPYLSISRNIEFQTKSYAVIGVDYQFALIEGPIGDGEPPACARSDSMGGSELRSLGSITSPNGDGLCIAWTTTRTCRRWRWHDAGKSHDNDGRQRARRSDYRRRSHKGAVHTRTTKGDLSEAF
jgi:hypothetical protein